MFNNIIYFIIVLLVYTSGPSDRDKTEPLLFSISMIFILWLVFIVYCRTGFKRLVSLYQKGSVSGYATMYNRLVLRLSVSAIFIFSIDVFAFRLKYLIESTPLAGNLYFVQGLLAIILFTLYLSTIWYFAQPAYNVIFFSDIGKKAFILGNIRLNLPVIFPWLLLSIGFDFVSMSPWTGLNSFLDLPVGQILFFGIFLGSALIFLPALVQFFWGCRPVEDSSKAESIRNFLKDLDFKYRALVNWPLLGGKMLTAGIMGIIPRFRYIMVTESLMEILNPSELNAVMAHEAGHAKYYHQLLLSLFFLGFFVLLMGFIDLGFYEIFIKYIIYRTIGDIKSYELYTIIFNLPILIALIIYFRFIMGFFMRNFERQADAYAARKIGDPSPIISSLEKIALLSGKIREVPSWHHFSIKQRVDFLLRSRRDSKLIGRHRRLLLSSFVIYLGVILSLSYILYLTPVKEHFIYDLWSRILTREIEKEPHNIKLRLNRAGLYSEMGRPGKAAETYEKALLLDGKYPALLNDYAWLLLTTDDPNIKDIKKGFKLAKEAVKLERLPEFLDTLAEAYWANGNNEMAVKIEKEAIMHDKTDNSHYRKQLEKFINVRKVNI